MLFETTHSSNALSSPTGCKLGQLFSQIDYREPLIRINTLLIVGRNAGRNIGREHAPIVRAVNRAFIG
jgi:hypothetical protein